MSERIKKITGPCIADFVVLNVPYHEVKTEEEIQARELWEKRSKMVCVMPFKEIHCGEESIYDYVKEGYQVPDKVIAYLQTTNPYMMCPGIYEHPFKKGESLLGPYMYTDGHYWWDRDAWKYVVKYHVMLPQAFVDYVMSDLGTKYLEEFSRNNESWQATIKDWKESENYDLCLLPDNAGDIELENF
jgi:hypothetical protein